MKVSFAIETAQLTIFLKSTNKNYMRVTAAFKFNVKLLVSITVGKNLEEYASWHDFKEQMLLYFLFSYRFDYCNIF